MTQEINKLNIDANNAVTLVNTHLPPLQDSDVRIQVLFSNINKNDLQGSQRHHKNNCFGSEAVGKVIAVGKNVGHCKIGQTVGVHCQSNQCGQFTTGFSSHLQVHQDCVVYIPDSISPEQAGIFLGSGAIAFNAVEKVVPQSQIAVVGSNHLAYLIVQFAKKKAGCTVTLFDYEGNQETAKSMGADNFVALSKASIGKHVQKFKSVVITDFVKEEQAFCIQDMVWRSGFVIFATTMGYSPKISTLDFMTGQKGYLGAGRGPISQAINALKAAAYYNIRGKVEIIEAGKYQQGFNKMKESKGICSIALKY